LRIWLLMGASRGLLWPIVRLGAGTALVALGCAVEIVEDQNVYTISQSISLPALLAIVVGLVLVATGYSRVLRCTYGATRRIAFGVGVAAGAATYLISWWWLLTYGFTAYLEASSVGLVLFGGAAMVQVGCRFATAPKLSFADRDAQIRGNARPSPLFLSSSARTAVAWALIGVAVVLLGEMALNLGWLNNQAATVDPAYQYLAIEVMGPAAWWLATGYSGLIDNLSPRPALWAGLGGIGAGAAFVLGGYAWWSGWSLYPELVQVIFILLTITGLGLCLFSASSLRRRTALPSGVAL
jgi:hypothetical protein